MSLLNKYRQIPSHYLLGRIMAIFEVKVPQLSESVAEATLLQWKKKVGQAVAQDEILIEIETDKVVLEVPSPSAGVLVDLVVGDGGTVVAEQVIAKIDSTATASATAAPAIAVAPAATSSAAPATKPAAAPIASASAAPSAAKMMAEKNISPAQVAGTGRDGRITKGDVIGAAAGGSKPTKVMSPALPGVAVPMGERPEERVPMSRLRARIAERLLESQANNAILTTFNEVNMGPVESQIHENRNAFVPPKRESITKITIHTTAPSCRATFTRFNQLITDQLNHLIIDYFFKSGLFVVCLTGNLKNLTSSSHCK
jgi:2-oxoglutarate dehydrogenase E2 component (dihydrolipoamide succinyltransferase)